MHGKPVQTIVVGAGGHGAEVATYLSDLMQDGWLGSFLGFLDDSQSHPAMRYGQILGTIDEFQLRKAVPAGQLGYIVAVGQNRIRKQLVERIESRFGPDIAAFTLVHPRAYVGRDVEIGEGTLLAPFALVTTRILLGRHVILNVKASVSHDAVIGDYAIIDPAATICGNVTVGEGAYIGAGAVVKERVSIGAWSTIGAGAVVIDDIPPLSVAVGVSARVIKSLAEPGKEHIQNVCR